MAWREPAPVLRGNCLPLGPTTSDAYGSGESAIDRGNQSRERQKLNSPSPPLPPPSAKISCHDLNVAINNCLWATKGIYIISINKILSAYSKVQYYGSL